MIIEVGGYLVSIYFTNSLRNPLLRLFLPVASRGVRMVVSPCLLMTIVKDAKRGMPEIDVVVDWWLIDVVTFACQVAFEHTDAADSPHHDSMQWRNYQHTVVNNSEERSCITGWHCPWWPRSTGWWMRVYERRYNMILLKPSPWVIANWKAGVEDSALTLEGSALTQIMCGKASKNSHSAFVHCRITQTYPIWKAKGRRCVEV